MVVAPGSLHSGRTTLRALAQRFSELPPYPTAAALAVVLLCTGETLVIPGPITLAYAGQLFALAAPIGAVLGLFIALLLTLGERISAVHRLLTPWTIWPVLGMGVGASIANMLGAFQRLGTHYDRLARFTLVGAIAGGLALGVLIAALQPTARHPRGFLVDASSIQRAIASVVLVAGACALSYADHTLYVGLYVPAHVALRVSAALLIATALAISAAELLLPRFLRQAWIAIALVLCIPLASLDEHDSDVVQSMVMRPWPATVLRVARSVFDLDRDGFSYLLGGGDCNDWSRDINPGAREVPGNGIDDNCLFGDRAKVVSVAAPPAVPAKPSPMSVVLITLDAVRWDRFGGNDPTSGPRGRNTMPNIERFARGGVLFKKAYSTGAWTSIAIGTMMRGLHARKLAWSRYYETSAYRLVKAPITGRLAAGEQPAKMFPLGFEDPHWPLAYWLKRRGMRTIGVVDDGFSQMLSSTVGPARGFDVYREVNVEPVSVAEANREKKIGRRATRDDTTTAAFAIAELRKYGTRKEPFFMWTHFFGAHTPSREHPGVPKTGDSVSQLYDHEVRFVDQQVERVLDAVRKLDRKVAVFITSDHGEAFFSRYRSHGADMSDDVLAVPLIAKVPGWKSRAIDTPVSSVDIMPTILGVTGTPLPAGLDGIDLGRLVRGEKLEERVLLSDTWQFGNDSKAFSELVAAFDGKHKVVLDRIDHSFSVYDQTNPSAPPLRVEGLANGKLARSILGYLEDTGGQLTMQEEPPSPKAAAKAKAEKAKKTAKDAKGSEPSKASEQTAPLKPTTPAKPASAPAAVQPAR